MSRNSNTTLNSVRFLAILLVLGMFQTSCTKNGKDSIVSKGTKAGILHKGNGTEPKDLDPHTTTGVPEHKITSALFEGLIEPDPKTLAPTPGMATSWTISKDGTVYTFKMRKGAKWSNGDPVTAHDFQWSWMRALNPALASEYAYMLFVVKNAEAYNSGKIKDFSKVGAKALDAETFQVTLNASTPYFLGLLMHHSTYPVHRKTIEKHGKWNVSGNQWTRPGNLVGNGAFSLSKWELNKIIVVKKNPLYWDAERVRLNEIHFYPIESDQTEERAFRAEQLHITNTVPLTKILTYQKKNPDLIRITPYLGTYYYRMNVVKKPFNDIKVRQAVNMAIDRQAIVDSVTKAGEMPAFSFVPPDLAGYNSRNKTEFNIEKAKKLLAEAGYPDGKGWPANVSLLYNTLESHKVIAEAIQQMLKSNLGIHISLTNQDWKVYLSSQKSLDYNVSRAGWIGDYADPNTFMDMFVTNGGNNQTGWSNIKYDQLIAKAAVTSDLAARLEVFHEAEKILMEEGPIIPIYTYVNKALARPSLKGWYPNIMDWHPYKYVWLEEAEDVKLSQK